jgi:hypothetical protein
MPRRIIVLSTVFFGVSAAFAQVSVPWGGYANNAQHTAQASTGAQPLNAIHWSTPVDLNPPGGGAGDLLIHYGSPMVSAANTMLLPVKTGNSSGFEVMALNAASGAPMYTLPSDYILPPHNWIPPYSAVLTAGNRLYYAGAGGTVYYRDSVDSLTGPNGFSGATGQIAFYGNSVYAKRKAIFDLTVQISTPLTADSSGNIYFGFHVRGANPANLVSGIAHISAGGVGTWVSAASTAGGDTSITGVELNCSPALSNDQQSLYIAVSNGASDGAGYLVSLQSSNLAPIGRVQLMDPRGGPATLSSDSSAAPMVGPDGDVYYGVLEYPCCSSHNDRGWLLHFDSTLTVAKIPGSFGWDDTASVVPAAAVPSYTGTSSYLVLTKYNNYKGAGTGDGVNKVAVLDPNASQPDEYSTTPVSVMKEIITVTGVTPDRSPGFPNAVKEWCINSAAIDAVNKAAFINSEDGVAYHWDFTANTLSQRLRLTAGRGEAYTPTIVGEDGTAFAINDAILFAIGK